MTSMADIAEKCKPYRIGENIFNQYVLNDFLGQGGFGRVFLVENRAGTFALKVVRDNISMDIRGMETVRNVNSTRLVKFLDYGKTTHGEDCFVMEYVDNNMADILQNSQMLDMETAGDYFQAIVESLMEMERFHIIHRDIKPSNLFMIKDVSGNLLAKIGDFATAKILNQNSVTQSKVLGTVHYMSPEHFKKGGGHCLDRWPAAVILYQMLTGKFAFDGDDPTEIIGAIITCRPDLSLVPKSFVPFFRKCFDANPENRHQSAEEMLRHFQACREMQSEVDMSTSILDVSVLKQHILASGGRINPAPSDSHGLTDPLSGAIEMDGFDQTFPGVDDGAYQRHNVPGRRGRVFSPPVIIFVIAVVAAIALGMVLRNMFFSPEPATQDLSAGAPSDIRVHPAVTSGANAEQLISINANKRPKTVMENDFIPQPEGTVQDTKTGRVWKMLEAREPISRQGADVRILTLNAESGHSRPAWRLPTVSELFTLMASEKLNDQTYLKYDFGTDKRKFWSADQTDAGLVWFVDFNYGIADVNFPDSGYYVLAVKLAE